MLKAKGDLFHIPPKSPQEGEEVTVIVIVESDSPVIEAKLLHRVVGQTSYHEVRMIYENGVWKGTIPPTHVVTEGLEYIIIVNLADGSVLGFPSEDPFNSPYSMSVSPREYARKFFEREGITQRGESFVEADILIISPEEGKIVSPDELLIVVSLFNVTGIDTNSIQLFLDGENVTSQAAVSSDIVTYSPKSIEPGVHTANILLRNIYGYTYKPVTWSFTVSGGETRIITAMDEFSYSAKTRADFSLDRVEKETLPIAQSKTYLEGGWQWLKFRSEVKITTEESVIKQPRNRYSATIQSGTNLTVWFGDFTPVLSQYTIDGKRVRGVGIDVNLNWLRLQIVDGELERAIQGDPEKVDNVYQITNIQSIGSGKPQYTLDRLGYTFKRSLKTYRLSLNYRDRYRLGLNLQKAKDDPVTVNQEIKNAKFEVPDWEEFVSETGIDSGIYTFDQFKDAIEGIATYKLDSKDWGGVRPQDNIVLGFDMGMAFDERRLTFETAWAISLVNRDIWPGALTLSKMDTVLDDSLDGYVGRIYDENGLVTSSGFSLEDIVDPSIVKDFFIVNQNMTPLVPIDFESYQNNQIAAIMNMPSVGYMFKMKAYYYDNTLQLQYSQVGPEFTSLANPYFTKNVREFTISDRIRLLDNKLLVAFNYRHRNNKILKTVTDPYSQNTVMLNFTLTPGIGLPSFTFNFQSVGRDNSKTEFDTLTTSIGDSLLDLRENSRTRNALFSINIPMKAKNIQHNFSATLNTINVDDLLEDKRKEGYVSPATQTRSFTLGFTSQFTFPLRTSFDLTQYIIELPPLVTQGKLISNESRFTNIGFNATYKLWSNKLRLNGGLSYLFASGVSRFSNFGITSAVEYKPFKKLSTRMSISTKIRKTQEEIVLGTLAVKFSINYVF